MSFRWGHALLIGIDRYSGNIQSLPPQVLDDARDLREILVAPASCAYPPEQVQIILGADATSNGLREGLRRLAGAVGPEDTAVVYFSGHGGLVESGPDAGSYLIPYDCDPNRLRETAISGDELTGLLRAVEPARLLVVLDCCHAAGIGRIKELVTPGLPFMKAGFSDREIGKLAQGKGRVLMASSRPDEPSLILNNAKNSLFTESLLEALRGGTRTRGDGLIRVFDLFDHVSERVPAQANQHPVLKAEDLEDNFAVAFYQGGKPLRVRLEDVAGRPSVLTLRTLRDTIIQKYSLGELKALCFDVDSDLHEDGFTTIRVELEEIGGENKTVMVQNLIGFLERRDKLAYLLAAVRRSRPGLI
jgi:uncharacterized caspase-like protein